MPDGGTKGGGVNKVFGSLGGIENFERVGVSTPYPPLAHVCPLLKRFYLLTPPPKKLLDFTPFPNRL